MDSVYEAIIFDFDYTLADATPGIVRCTNYAFMRLHLDPVPSDAIRRTVGLALSEMYHKLSGRPSIDEAEEFKRYFVERADQIMADNTVMLPGVPEALGALCASGLRLAIVSSKYRYRIQTVLERDGLADHFETIVGAEDVSDLKPDPQSLLLAVERLGAQRTRVLYVGDNVVDGQAARRADLAFVAVLSGATTSQELAACAPIALLHGVGALPAWLAAAR